MLNTPLKNIRFVTGLSQIGQLDQWFSDHKHFGGVCFVGRSNVGKSTLINSLFGAKIARVSKSPGKTREINIYGLEENTPGQNTSPIYFFDLPGHGYAQVAKSVLQNWQTLIDKFFCALPTHAVIINVQDARRLWQKSDQGFFQYFQNFPNKMVLVCNKIDKLKTQKEKIIFARTKAHLMKNPKIVGIFSVSAKQGRSLEELHASLTGFLWEDKNS